MEFRGRTTLVPREGGSLSEQRRSPLYCGVGGRSMALYRWAERSGRALVLASHASGSSPRFEPTIVVSTRTIATRSVRLESTGASRRAPSMGWRLLNGTPRAESQRTTGRRGYAGADSMVRRPTEQRSAPRVGRPRVGSEGPPEWPLLEGHPPAGGQGDPRRKAAAVNRAPASPPRSGIQAA